MANIVRKRKRVMAVGCTHGDLIDTRLRKQVLDFKARYRPEVRFDLGDDVDTAAFRSGARHSKDESRPIAPDFNAGVRWLEDYEPTHLSWGNHDWRVYELQDHYNAQVAELSRRLWTDLNNAAKHAKKVPYDFEHGWFEMGGVAWGHGYWFNEAAVRDHAEYLGMPVVMAHVHVPQSVPGRTRKETQSFCVGLLGDRQKMAYARRRRATSRWRGGCVFGEISDKDAYLWLAEEIDGEIRFPL